MAFYEEWFKDCSWKKIAFWVLGIASAVTIITVLIIAFGVVYPPKATVEDAALQRFALSAPSSPSSPANATLSYNVTVALSLWNPNMYRAISYSAIAASFHFNGTRFDDTATVPPFDHAKKKSSTVRVTVGGVDRPLKLLSAAGVAEFGREKEAGKFQVEMRLDTVMQYKGRKAKCPLSVVCPLQLQLIDPEVAATAFQKTKCNILKSKISGC